MDPTTTAALLAIEQKLDDTKQLLDERTSLLLSNQLQLSRALHRILDRLDVIERRLEPPQP